MAKPKTAPCVKRRLRFLKRRGPLLLFLLACLLLRALLYSSLVPRAHIDSVTYLVLSDLNPVRTPGYPVFIALLQFFNDLFSLTPRYLHVIVFGQMFILGLLNSYLIYLLARRISGSEGFALFMGVIYNLDYFVIGFEYLVLTETLSLTLLGLTLLFYLKIFEQKKSAPYLAGLLSVGLLLTRPSFVALFLCLAAASALVHWPRKGKGGGLRAWLRPLAIFLLLNFVGLLSWSLRNKVKHDYFGVSTILPFQLGYFTQHFYWKYKPGSDTELDRLASIVFEEKGQPFRVTWRLIEDWQMPEVEISRLLLRFNLRLIRDNPGDYLRLLPTAAAHYYDYSWYWTELQDRGIFERFPFLAPPLRFFSHVYAWIFKKTMVLVMAVLVIPVIFLVAVRKRRNLFHPVFLLEGTIHYNFFITILLTPGGINNLRYRVPVEPLILLVLYGAIFFLGRQVGDWLCRHRASM